MVGGGGGGFFFDKVIEGPLGSIRGLEVLFFAAFLQPKMTEASVLRLSSKYETAAGANSNKGLVRNGKPLCLFRFQIGSKWHGFEEH